VGAGVIQLGLGALGAPGLGIWIVLPVALWVGWLWRPSVVQSAVVLFLLGLECVLPLQTGGGRYFDWDLHYQASVMLAFPHPTFLFGVGSSNVLMRTPLFAALVAAAVAHLSQYATFQVGSVLLNTLWMWPAGLLLARGGRSPDRVFAVACCPMVAVFMLFTWPWGFCCFWLLAALYFADAGGRISWMACGLCLGAALMTHEGCIGYVLGLVVWLAVRHRGLRGLLRGAGAGLGVCLALGAPWVVVMLRYASLSRIVQSLAGSTGDGGGWLAGRLELLVSTALPHQGGAGIIDHAFVFLSAGALGVTAALILTGTLRLPRGAAAWTCAGGLLGGLLLLPTANAASGLYDTAFPAFVLVFVASVTACPPARWRPLVLVGMALVTLTLAIVWVEAAFPAADDRNLLLKVAGHLRFVADFTTVPGLVLMVLGMVLGVVAVRRRSVWAVSALSP
jgi:hypothetical protein